MRTLLYKILVLLTVFLLLLAVFPKKWAIGQVADQPWQQVSSFPVTNITNLVNAQDKLYISVSQPLTERRGESGFYVFDGAINTKNFSHPFFQTNDLTSAGNTLYASFPQSGIVGPNGIYSSQDGGTTWQRINTVFKNTSAIQVQNSTLIAGTNLALWQSADNGQTWNQKLASNPVMAIAFQGQVALASMANHMYRSENSGNTWNEVVLPQLSMQHIGLHNNIALSGGSGSGLIRSTDGGKTWSKIYDVNEYNGHPIGPFAFADDGRIYAGGSHILNGKRDGTVYVSTDQGLTWTKVDQGIIHSPSSSSQMVTSLTVYKNKLYMALEQSGLFVRDLAIPKPIAKTPVIFIPGIGGSEFKVTEDFKTDIHDCGNPIIPSFSYKEDETVWVNEARALSSTCDDYFDVLKLLSDGVSPQYPQVTLKDSLYSRSYGNVQPFFESNGYTTGKDFFVFPYDWRLDIRQTTPTLDTLVNQALEKSGATKVSIVAHSMGGLVAREYIRDTSRAAKVDTLVTLGTPHLGSADAVVNLVYGGCLKVVILCVISGHEVSDVIQNSPGAFELINSKQYFDQVSLKPFKDDRDVDKNGITGELNYEQFKNLLLNIKKNSNAISVAESFHNDLDSAYNTTNGVKVFFIAGSGTPTVGQIREYNQISAGPFTIPKHDFVTINGDKTVPLYSAVINNQSNVYYVKKVHEQLASNEPLAMVLNLIQGSTKPTAGVQLQPYSLKGNIFSVHSPVELHIYDTNGNHTGSTVDGNFEENIPGSTYNTIDDTKFIFLPNDITSYHITTKATAAGTFDLKARTYDNDELTKETLYLKIPQTIQTTTTLNSDSPTLAIDQNGDGTTDTTIQPTSTISGPSAADTTAPVTTLRIDGNEGQHTWYRSDVSITLTGVDNTNGSGLMRTEYSLDGGVTIMQYKEPFIISKEGQTTVWYRSIDNLGNEEPFQKATIAIDKTAPEASIGFNPQKLEFTVAGIDNLGGPVEVTETNSQAKLTDQAGNTTLITFIDLGWKKRERLIIKTIQYNDQTPLTMFFNTFTTSYNLTKQNAIKELTQSIIIRAQERIKTEYDATKNRTKIIKRELGQPKKESTENGLVLFKIETKQGELTII